VTATLARLVPGLGLLVALGLVARAITATVGGSHLLVVIGLGVVIANTVGVPDRAAAGVGSHSLWLEAGIVLMGAGVALGRIADAGPRILAVVGLAVPATLLTVEAFGRGVFGVPEKAGSLLAAGAGICGVSAVAAVAGSIDPDRKQVAYAAATVLLFDAVTLVVYPAVGRLLGLSDVAFGLWAGATMFSTGPVTAAGFAYSRAAGEWAVLAKLTRNALIGAVAVGYALYYGRRAGAGPGTEGGTGTGEGVGNGAVGSSAGTWRYLWETFPKFVLGFLALLVLGSAGAFSPAQTAALGNASDWLFLVAFAGLGLSIDVRGLRETGLRPVLAVLASLIVVSSLVLLGLSRFLGG